MVRLSQERKDRIIFASLLLLSGFLTRQTYLYAHADKIKIKKSLSQISAGDCKTAQLNVSIDTLEQLDIEKTVYVYACLLREDPKQEYIDSFIRASKNELLNSKQKSWVIDYIAGTLISQDNIDSALEIYRTLLQFIAQEPTLLKKYAAALVQKGNFDDARKVYVKIVSKIPNDTESNIRLADIYLIQNNYNEAQSLLESLKNSTTQNSRLEYVRAKVSYHNKDYANALFSYNSYLQKKALYVGDREDNDTLDRRLNKEELSSIHLDIARIYRLQGEKEKALQHFFAASQYQEYSESIVFELSSLLLDLENPDLALNILSTHTLRSQSSIKLLSELLIGQNKFKEARKTLSSISNPDETTLTRIAMLDYWVGDNTSAAEKFENLVKSNPTDKNLIKTYADILLSLGKTDEAKKQLEKLAIDTL